MLVYVYYTLTPGPDPYGGTIDADTGEHIVGMEPDLMTSTAITIQTTVRVPDAAEAGTVLPDGFSL